MQLQEFRYLRVNYESHIDWKIVTNYLQCNPDFHGHEHYDCTLVCTIDRHNNKLIIVQFQFMFEYIVGDVTLCLALVMPLDFATGKACVINEDLQFICLVLVQQHHCRSSHSSPSYGVRSSCLTSHMMTITS